MTVHPTGTDRPNASNVNYYPGRNTANEVIARVGTNGSVSIYTHTATHLVIDIAGHLPTNTYTPSSAAAAVGGHPSRVRHDRWSRRGDRATLGWQHARRAGGRACRHPGQRVPSWC